MGESVIELRSIAGHGVYLFQLIQSKRRFSGSWPDSAQKSFVTGCFLPEKEAEFPVGVVNDKKNANT